MTPAKCYGFPSKNLDVESNPFVAAVDHKITTADPKNWDRKMNSGRQFFQNKSSFFCPPFFCLSSHLLHPMLVAFNENSKCVTVGGTGIQVDLNSSSILQKDDADNGTAELGLRANSHACHDL